MKLEIDKNQLAKKKSEYLEELRNEVHKSTGASA